MRNASRLYRDSQTKLDAAWAVQLFVRNYPYYARRANSRSADPLRAYDLVLSERLPRPDLPADVQAQLDSYTEQLWVMSIIYIEAILEHYFVALIESLGLSSGRAPRQAGRLFEYFARAYSTKFGRTIDLPPFKAAQLAELTATRHIWVHKDGVVDEAYLAESRLWWEQSSTEYPGGPPSIGSRRLLTETYIKASIYFCKALMQTVEEQLGEEASSIFEN